MTRQMIAWRVRNPRARRRNPVAIVHNGGTQRVYGCLCGEWVSMSARWPMTRRVAAWIADHNKRCQPVVVKR